MHSVLMPWMCMVVKERIIPQAFRWGSNTYFEVYPSPEQTAGIAFHRLLRQIKWLHEGPEGWQRILDSSLFNIIPLQTILPSPSSFFVASAGARFSTGYKVVVFYHGDLFEVGSINLGTPNSFGPAREIGIVQIEKNKKIHISQAVEDGWLEGPTEITLELTPAPLSNVESRNKIRDYLEQFETF